MKKIWIFLFLSPSLLLGQINADSLWGIWGNETMPDTNRLEAISTIIKEKYLSADPDSAFHFAQMQFEFAKEEGNKKYMADALRKQGISFYLRSNFSSAVEYYLKCLELDEVSDDSLGMSRTLHNLGVTFEVSGNGRKAFEYYTKAYKIHKAIGNKKYMAQSLMGIANFYNNQANYTKAVEYYADILKILDESRDGQILGIIYNNIGSIHLNQEDYSKALEYYNKGVAIYEKIDHKKGLSLLLGNIGLTLLYLKDYDKALEYGNSTLQVATEVNNKDQVAIALKLIGQTYQKKGNHTLALEYYKKSLEESEINNFRGTHLRTLNTLASFYIEQNGWRQAQDCSLKALEYARDLKDLPEEKYAVENLSIIYKKQKRYEEALEMYELYTTYKDSIFSQENQRETIKIEYKYQYEKQAVVDSVKAADAAMIQEVKLSKQQAELKVKQNQQFALMGCFGLASLFAFFMYNRFKVTQKQKGIIEEQKVRVDAQNGEITQQHNELQKNQQQIEETNTELSQANRKLSKTLEDLKLTQSQLIQSEKMVGIGQLTAGIAHEINNPINFITTGTYSLKRQFNSIKELLGLYDKIEAQNIQTLLPSILDFKKKIKFGSAISDVDEIMEAIEEGGNRISGIVKDLRTFSRLDENDRKPVDLHENIDATLTLVNTRLNDKVKLNRNYGDLPEVDCNPGQINQVILSILNNAIDAVGESGMISIKTEIISTPEESVQIVISDNGKGISNKIKNKIFDPFFTTKEVGKGKGLGLSTALAIIKEHNGTIDVSSQENIGSTFTIKFPIKTK